MTRVVFTAAAGWALAGLVLAGGCRSRAPGPRAAEPSAGCNAAGGLPEGAATIGVGGATRSYVLRLPQGYGKHRPWPLVLALHPNGKTPDYWDAESGERPLRATVRDQAILVLPAARAGDWRGDLPADLAYFEALLARLTGKLCVDRRRIFAMGFSGGGSFSGVLGCMRKDIRAIAAGGAVIYFDPRRCVGSPPAWVTIGQGETTAARTAFRDFWRTRNGCQESSTPTAPVGCVAHDCPAGARAEYCHHAGGHEWPSYGVRAAWAFFARF